VSTENKKAYDDYLESIYENLEKSFVTYNDLCDVQDLDKNTDNEKFSILPSTGRGVIGRYSPGFRDMEDTIPNIIVRETVYKKLCKVDKTLKQTYPNCQLVVIYGYRSPDIQKKEFDRIKNELRDGYPDANDSDLNEATHRIIAVPDVAGHPTGGAVDVTIFDFTKQEYWVFGTQIHEFKTKRVYYDSPEVKKNDPQAMKNRKFLRSIMGKQDFVPYDGEWWHFSYGDKEWAFYKHRDNKRKKRLTGELKYKYSQKLVTEIQYTDKYKEKDSVSDNCIRLAVQKEGRLTDETLSLLQQAGIVLKPDKRQFAVKSSNFPLEVLFVRDDDIPNLVYAGVADFGIVGENIFYETENDDLEILQKLGFGYCSLALAVPKDSILRKPVDLRGKKIATSYPVITRKFFESLGIDIKEYNIDIRSLSGSVEIAPAIGYADAIVDLVSTGVSLKQNNLIDMQKIMDSESVLIANKKEKSKNSNKSSLIERFLSKIETCLSAKRYKYVIVNVPIDFLNMYKKILEEEVKSFFPSFESINLDDNEMMKLFLEDENSLISEINNIIPKISNEENLEKVRQIIIDISNQHYSSLSLEKRQVHILVNKDSLWEEKLKRIRATDIIVLDVERYVY